MYVILNISVSMALISEVNNNRELVWDMIERMGVRIRSDRCGRYK